MGKHKKPYHTLTTTRVLPKHLAKLYRLETELLGDCPLKPMLREYAQTRACKYSDIIPGDCTHFLLDSKDHCTFAHTGYICSINARIRYYSMLRKGGLRDGINTKTGE